MRETFRNGRPIHWSARVRANEEQHFRERGGIEAKNGKENGGGEATRISLPFPPGNREVPPPRECNNNMQQVGRLCSAPRVCERERAKGRARGGEANGGELTQDRLQRLVLADHIHDARRCVFGGRLSGTGAVTPGYDVDQEPTMVTGARTHKGHVGEAPLAGQKEASRSAGHHVHCHLRSAGCGCSALAERRCGRRCRFAGVGRCRGGGSGSSRGRGG